jgi:hypothetical protein
MENIIYYAVKLNNTIVSQPYPTSNAAQQHVQHLTEAERPMAMVVQVTESGQELLFG